MVAFPSSQSVPRLWSPPLVLHIQRQGGPFLSLSLFSLVSLEPPPSMVLPIRPLEKWARGCRTKVGTFFRYSIGGRDSPSSRFPPRCEGTYVVFIVSRPSGLDVLPPPRKNYLPIHGEPCFCPVSRYLSSPTLLETYIHTPLCFCTGHRRSFAPRRGKPLSLSSPPRYRGKPPLFF